MDSLPIDKAVDAELKSALEPYLLEAGLDPDELNSERKITIDGLMMYHVLDKRRHELEELAKGIYFFVFLLIVGIYFMPDKPNKNVKTMLIKK